MAAFGGILSASRILGVSVSSGGGVGGGDSGGEEDVFTAAVSLPEGQVRAGGSRLADERVSQDQRVGQGVVQHPLADVARLIHSNNC